MVHVLFWDYEDTLHPMRAATGRMRTAITPPPNVTVQENPRYSDFRLRQQIEEFFVAGVLVLPIGTPLPSGFWRIQGHTSVYGEYRFGGVVLAKWLLGAFACDPHSQLVQ